MTWLVILKKFWPLFVIVPLAFVVLFQRNTITGRTAERDAAQVHVKDMSDANRSLARAIENTRQARIDNDAIAEAVAARMSTSNTRVIEYRTTVEKAKANEPAVRAWGAVPVPRSVREALRARSQPADAP